MTKARNGQTEGTLFLLPNGWVVPLATFVTTPPEWRMKFSGGDACENRPLKSPIGNRDSGR